MQKKIVSFFYFYGHCLFLLSSDCIYIKEKETDCDLKLSKRFFFKNIKKKFKEKVGIININNFNLETLSLLD